MIQEQFGKKLNLNLKSRKRKSCLMSRINLRKVDYAFIIQLYVRIEIIGADVSLCTVYEIQLDK